MPAISGLRSCYARVGRLVYFGRMLDKIRLQAVGTLPEDYQANLGKGFDARCCNFLGVAYPALVAQVATGASDDEILAWCHHHGGDRTDDECAVWSRFLSKVGWRDDRTPVLRQRIVEYGLANKNLIIETFFDLNEYDEGRDPVGTQAWLT